MKQTVVRRLTNGLSIRTLMQVAAMGIDVHVMQIVVRILVLCSASVAVNRINSDGRWKTLNCIFPIIWTLRLMTCHPKTEIQITEVINVMRIVFCKRKYGYDSAY